MARRTSKLTKIKRKISYAKKKKPKKRCSKDRWIQCAVKHGGALRNWMLKHYGTKAFTNKGTIKTEYLNKAYKYAKKTGNTKLMRRINLAKIFRKLRRK